MIQDLPARTTGVAAKLCIIQMMKSTVAFLPREIISMTDHFLIGSLNNDGHMWSLDIFHAE